MNKTLSTYLLVFIFTLFSCNSNKHDELNKFEKNIGKEKFEVLNESVESLEEFLAMNFKDCENQNEQIIEFLKVCKKNDFKPLASWIYNEKRNLKLIELFDKTKIRKDLWKYGFEIRMEEEQERIDYYNSSKVENEDSLQSLGELDDFIIEEEILPITREGIVAEIDDHRNPKNDSVRFASGYSNIVIAMHKSEIKDSLVIDYISAKFAAGDISPYLFVNGFLEKKDKYEYDSYFAKLIVVIEMYYGIVYHQLEQNEL